ncbi:MAG: prepilin-type N-terminal cleavage/methylation domain-containing protein [Candidatus Nomurabacteria bacterium]|nr:prepilin-type N-terminal cleavage/methylation domain-containing protein [Candidatus Nomurabacteria bacterium]
MKVGRESYNRQSGFTIIEVMLVLAVSFLLLGVVVFGTYRMIFDSRFTDTISSAASFLQTQYEETRSGVRPRTVAGDASNCLEAGGKSGEVLLGKLVVFPNGGNIMYSYFVTGNAITFEKTNAETDVTGSFISDNIATKKIIDSGPKAVSCGSQSKELEWSAEITENGVFNYAYSDSGVLIDDSSGSEHRNFNAILLIRNPYGTDIMTYSFFINETEYVKLGELSGDAWTTSFGTAVERGVVSNFNKKSVIIVRNTDSFTYRSLGVICIDPGANSAAVYGSRGLDGFEGVRISANGNPDFTHLSIDRITNKTKTPSQVIKEKCEQ